MEHLVTNVASEGDIGVNIHMIAKTKLFVCRVTTQKIHIFLGKARWKNNSSWLAGRSDGMEIGKVDAAMADPEENLLP